MASASLLQKMDDASFDGGGGDLNASAMDLNDTNVLGNGFKKVAIEFQKELQSVLKAKPPISKEKINLIVDEAIKAVRNYKHVVYYIETFIKTVSKQKSQEVYFLFLNNSFLTNNKVSASIQAFWFIHNRCYNTQYEW